MIGLIFISMPVCRPFRPTAGEVIRVNPQGLIYTNDNCISCNKCVRVCTSPGASYVSAGGGDSAVHIDPLRCVSCGACFAQCDHNAREYRDDTQAFFDDLRRGEPISILVAPAFRASYPDEYAAVLGGLKALGVRRIVSVAFGADICTWAYLKLMREENLRGMISTPCPVAVSYIEHCVPELIPQMIPVYSPMVCAAIYCREELGITDRLAFISPCIGKKLETDAYGDSPVHYNVTFLKLMEYMRRNNITGPDASDEIEYGLGSFYPAPGGLADNVRWFLGDDEPIRVVSGKTYLYGWFNKNAQALRAQKTPFLFIDALNCQDGCIEGTACETARFEEDRVYYNIQNIKAQSKRDDADSPWNARLSPEERLRRLNAQFDHLPLSHYLRGFTDRSDHCAARVPTEEDADRIFNEMHKTTPESRVINCSACGYNTCRDMMVAIFNGFNTKRSCIHFEMDEALRLERLSYNDQLTGALNRTALQKVLTGMMYHNRSVAVIAADIDGLKEVNDTQGHEAGDRLIVTVANALSAAFGGSNIFRTGGDEYIVILQDHDEAECCDSIARVKQSLLEDGVSVSFGYAFTAEFDSNYHDLQAIADKNMYAQKEEHYRRLGRKPR